MRSTSPAVAVIMTAYNSESTIEASLRSALAQDYEGPLKVVVVDDGSRDQTLEILGNVDDDRLTVVRPGRLGRARALNAALDEAHGSEFVANLDSDDYMLPNRISSQIEQLVASPSLGVLGSAYYEVHQAPDRSVDGTFVVRPPVEWSELRRQFAMNFPICHSCATFRREAAIRLGGYDARRRARIDFDLWLRIAGDGYEIANLPDVLGVHVKRSGTFFDGEFAVLRSAAQMARLNFGATRRLGLGAEGYLRAGARFGYSLLRRQSVKSVPRFGREVPGFSEDLESLMGMSDLS